MMNSSMDKQSSHLKKYLKTNQEIKPKSALKSHSKFTKSRLKNVSFDAQINNNSTRGNANSSYLALRNNGYLTSDILGSNNITAEMIKVDYGKNIARRPTFTKNTDNNSPFMYRSNISKSNSSYIQPIDI